MFSEYKFSFDHWDSPEWLFHPVEDVVSRCTAFPSLTQKQESLKLEMTSATTKEQEYVLFKDIREIDSIKKQQCDLWKTIDYSYDQFYQQLNYLEAVRPFYRVPWSEYDFIMRATVVPEATKYYDSFLELVKSEQRACKLIHGEQCSIITPHEMKVLQIHRDAFVVEHVLPEVSRPAQNHLLRRAVNKFNKNICSLFQDIEDHWNN